VTRISPALNPSFVRQQGQFGNAPQPPKNARGTAHLVAAVHWPPGVRPKDYGACRTSCECGWEGTVDGWQEHKVAAGEVRRVRSER